MSSTPTAAGAATLNFGTKKFDGCLEQGSRDGGSARYVVFEPFEASGRATLSDLTAHGSVKVTRAWVAPKPEDESGARGIVRGRLDADERRVSGWQERVPVAGAEIDDGDWYLIVELRPAVGDRLDSLEVELVAADGVTRSATLPLGPEVRRSCAEWTVMDDEDA